MELKLRYEQGLWSVFMRLLFIDLFLKCCLVNDNGYLHYLENIEEDLEDIFMQVSFFLFFLNFGGHKSFLWGH